jgi:sulfur carrier protein ThiS
MHITLKLFASLADHLPAGAKNNQVSLDVSDSITVGALIDERALPPKLVHLVLVNGSFIAPGERAGHRLHEGDALAIWPPIAGG